LNSRKPHTTPQLCERTTFTKIINKNNEIAINAKEQTVVHHSNRPVALASMNIIMSVFKTRLFMKPLFLAVMQLPYFKIPW